MLWLNTISEFEGGTGQGEGLTWNVSMSAILGIYDISQIL